MIVVVVVVVIVMVVVVVVVVMITHALVPWLFFDALTTHAHTLSQRIPLLFSCLLVPPPRVFRVRQLLRDNLTLWTSEDAPADANDGEDGADKPSGEAAA